jgi:hypothetical protein
MFKSAVFAVILICFHIIEETLIGVLHAKTFSQTPDLGDKAQTSLLKFSVQQRHAEGTIMCGPVRLA